MSKIEPSPPRSTREGGATFPLRHRLIRVVWNLVWGCLGAWTPVPFFAWRRLLLVTFGAKVSKTARVYPKTKIWYPENLKMDAFACLASGVNCYCMAEISLGKYVVVSQGAYLCAGSHDIDDPEFPLITKPIHIEADAWVAAEAFVGPGVRIGRGAVLGARGCTFRNLDAWTVYVGNPARPVRMRNIKT